MSLIIDDLSSSSDTELLDDLTPGEMKTILGGSRRRRRRGGSATTLDREELSARLQEINENITAWRAEIDAQLEDLRDDVNLNI
jgi:hypothetical protein